MQPCQIISLLSWCFENEQYCEAQTSRSWAYFGTKRGTIKFSVPQMPSSPYGLRIAFEPYPVEIRVDHVHFRVNGTKVTRSFGASALKIDTAGPSEKGSNGYCREVKSSSLAFSSGLVLHASRRLAEAIRRGGVLEISVTASFESSDSKGDRSGSEKKPETGLGDSLSYGKVRTQMQIVSRENQQLLNELSIMRSTLESIYHSRAWQLSLAIRQVAARTGLSTLVRRGLLLKESLSAVMQSGKLKAPATPVDIIIPVHNGGQIVKDCINSVLQSNSSVPHELIVIDDASTDADLVAFLESLNSERRITLLKKTGQPQLHCDHSTWVGLAPRPRRRAFEQRYSRFVAMVGSIEKSCILKGKTGNSDALLQQCHHMQLSSHGWIGDTSFWLVLQTAGCVVLKEQSRSNSRDSHGSGFLHVYSPRLPEGGR